MEGTESVSTGSTGSTTTGPTSFSDPSLTWSGASSTPTPSGETTPSASASADTTDPSAATTPEGQTPAAGEPPKERWADILANARAKAAEEATAPIAWAKHVDQQQLQHALSVTQKLRVGGTPEEFIQGLQEVIADARQSNPAIEAALRSFQGRALAALKQQQQRPAESQEPQPDLPIQLENGQVVHLYSAEQQAKRDAFLHQQWMQGVKQELQPLQEMHAQQQQAVRAQQQHAQAVSHADAIHADIAKLPGVTEDAFNKMAQEIANDPLLPPTNKPRTREEVHLAAWRAYQKVVLPTLGQQAEAKLLDSLKTKAAASNTVNPGSVASSTPKNVSSFFDKSLAWK